MRRCATGLLGVLLSGVPAMALPTTTVQGPLYRADGTAATGTLLLSWPSFIASDGSAVAAGSTTVAIGSGGSFTLALTPNEGATPAGTYYTAVLHAQDGTVQKEYWVVPQNGPVTVGLIRASVVPAAVAQSWSNLATIQSTLLSSLQGSYLPLKGGSLTGTLLLPTDPALPMQAATKSYVDAHAGATLPVNAIPYQGTPGSTPVAATADKIVAPFHSVIYPIGPTVLTPIDTTFAEGAPGSVLESAMPAIDTTGASWIGGGHYANGYGRFGPANGDDGNTTWINTGSHDATITLHNTTWVSAASGNFSFYFRSSGANFTGSLMELNYTPSTGAWTADEAGGAITTVPFGSGTVTPVAGNSDIVITLSGSTVSFNLYGNVLHFTDAYPVQTGSYFGLNPFGGVGAQALTLELGELKITEPGMGPVPTTVACGGILHSDGVCGIVASNAGVATDSGGHATALPELGTTTDGGGNTTVAWHEDLNKGIFDVRRPRVEKIDGSNTVVSSATSPALAFQQMAWDMACWEKANGRAATTQFPPGKFKVGLPGYPGLTYPPGNYTGTALGLEPGTEFDATYNNAYVFSVLYSTSYVAQCQDGTTANYNLAGGGEVDTLAEKGCTQGGCINAPGDTQTYVGGGPNQGGILLYLSQGHGNLLQASYNGGAGIHTDFSDSHYENLFAFDNLTWWRFDRGIYNRIVAPRTPTATPSTTGGTLAAGTYFYKVTALFNGETVGSSEVSATTTGTTSSVALSWPAVTLPYPNVSATGYNYGITYRVYRGTSAGAESTFYAASSNSFTDTGAAGTAGTVPGTNTTGTYTPANDGMHGGVEMVTSDGRATHVETYGTNGYTPGGEMGHVCGVVEGGGATTMDDIFAQVDEFGVCRPAYQGSHGRLSNIRAEAMYGPAIYNADGSTQVINFKASGACLNQAYVTAAGHCAELETEGFGITTTWTHGEAYGNGFFGTSYRTAFVYGPGNFDNVNVANGDNVQSFPGDQTGEYSTFQESDISLPYGGSVVSGATPDVGGKFRILMQNATATNVTDVAKPVIGQTLHLTLDANTTLVAKINGGAFQTCTGQNITGPTPGPLTFWVFDHGQNRTIAEECDPAAVVGSAEAVTFSATPVFAKTTRSSSLTLMGNVTSFTLPAGVDGQEKTLIFCQDATGGRTVAGPVNVHGLMTVGAMAAKCSAQHFTYAAAQGAWLADGPGVGNE